MRKFSLIFVMLALVLALCLAFLSCDDGGNDGGGSADIRLVNGIEGIIAYDIVRFNSPSGVRGNTNDFTLTINGANVPIRSSEFSFGRQTLRFNKSDFPVTVGTRYSVVVTYNGGSTGSPFTVSGNVTCEQGGE